jgi:tetratricopeptide (TPR) repeat protein
MKNPTVVGVISVALIVASLPGVVAGESEVPQALRLYVEARVAEAAGEYREALDLYGKANEMAPAQNEIRVAYASLLSDLGLASSAVELLEGIDDLDWLGLRTRALARAQIAARSGEGAQAAEQDLRTALAERPDDPNVQLGLAQLLMRQNRPAEAEELIAGLRSRRPQSGRLLAMHATVLRQIGQQERAADLFEQCVDGPGVGERCQQGLIEVLLELEQPGRAGRAMTGWLDADDLDGKLEAASLLLRGGRPHEALAVIEPVVAAQPESQRARRLEVTALLAAGRQDEAAAGLRRLLRKERDSIGLQVQLAWVEAQRGLFDTARELLDTASQELSGQPRSAAFTRLCLTGAQVELLAERPLRARDWLKRIEAPIEAGPDYVRLLADTYRQSDVAESAHKAVGEMLRLQPMTDGRFRDVALAAEAEFRFRAGESGGLERLAPLLGAKSIARVLTGVEVLQRLEQWEKVVEATSEALKRFPNQRTLQFAQAAALERLGRFEDAQELFLHLVEAYPEDAASANYLGYMWAEKGVKLNRAAELIARAVELEPNSPAYLDSLGWVYYRLGRLEEALHWLGRAVELSQGDGTILAHKGEVLVELDRPEEARQLLQRALDLGCDDPDRARELLRELEGAD